MNDRKSIIRRAVDWHDGKFPRQCFSSGVIFFESERITIKEFNKIAKLWRLTK
jgi:hypothetical protein